MIWCIFLKNKVWFIRSGIFFCCVLWGFGVCLVREWIMWCGILIGILLDVL